MSLVNDEQLFGSGSTAAVGKEPAQVKRRTQAERSGAARERLVRAAMEVIAEHGLERFTLAEVGERAGNSRALPARYFSNKAGLIRAVVDKVFAARSRPPNGSLGLARLLYHVGARFDGDPLRLKCLVVIEGEALAHDGVRALVAQANAGLASRIERHLVAALAAGEIREDVQPQLQAVLIMSGIHGAVRQWSLDPRAIDLGALRDAFVAALRRSLEVDLA